MKISVSKHSKQDIEKLEQEVEEFEEQFDDEYEYVVDDDMIVTL